MFMGVRKLKKVFVVDFDGTITKKDVGLSIVKKFAAEGWMELGQLWLNKKINTAQCGQKQWNLISKTDEEIKEYAKGFEINPGFKEFIRMINDNDYKIVIASDGYDIYINEILHKNGYNNIEICCNNAVYNNGWKLSFLNKDKECELCGNCKRKVVKNLKKNGYEVVYIGDGYSDRCACTYADVIFAKSFLKTYCEEQSIVFNSFDTFFDILNYM